MVDVNADNICDHSTMVEANADDALKSAWRRDAGGSELAHDVADVAAEDFDQLECSGDGRDIAARLQDADVGRGQTGALGQLLARPAALLAELAKDRPEAVGVRVVFLPMGMVGPVGKYRNSSRLTSIAIFDNVRSCKRSPHFSGSTATPKRRSRSAVGPTAGPLPARRRFFADRRRAASDPAGQRPALRWTNA